MFYVVNNALQQAGILLVDYLTSLSFAAIVQVHLALYKSTVTHMAKKCLTLVLNKDIL